MLPVKSVVYTGVFGSYDDVQPISVRWGGCDFVCFTDNANIQATGWTVKILNYPYLSDVEKNRRIKFHPHLYLPDYEVSLYLDGNVWLKKNPTSLMLRYASLSNIAIPSHPDRTCLYEEAKYWAEGHVTDREIVSYQLNKYRSEGFPENFGLTENGIMVRRHNDPAVIELMNMWWREYMTGLKRDQLSLQYAQWRCGIPITELVEGPRISREYFFIRPHSASNTNIVTQFVNRINNERYLSNWYLLFYKIIQAAFRIRERVRAAFGRLPRS